MGESGVAGRLIWVAPNEVAPLRALRGERFAGMSSGRFNWGGKNGNHCYKIRS
jgi:hypothetical protein